MCVCASRIKTQFIQVFGPQKIEGGREPDNKNKVIEIESERERND